MISTISGLLRVVSLGVVLGLAGCGGDRSEVTSGTGDSGVSSDGGAGSAAFAGTYRGTITLSAKGSEVDNTQTSKAVLVVRDDGTAQLSIDDQEPIQGFMNGNKFGFSVRVIEEEDLLKCDADAILTGSISGNRGTGTVSGSGECKLITAKTGFTVSGTLSVSR